LELNENLRNTRQIGAVLTPLATPKPRLLGGAGPPVRFVAATDGTAMDRADDAALALLDEGWDPRDVAVLTTQHRHLEQISRIEHFGRDGYWDSFWDGDDLFYSTVAGFKGLERPAVVLAVDGLARRGDRAGDPQRGAEPGARPAGRDRRPGPPAPRRR
jgi:hypothetical protein